MSTIARDTECSTPNFSPDEATRDFATAMAAVGLSLQDGGVVADGQLHRYRILDDKKGTRNGWYILHPDDWPAGVFGTWKNGEAHTWSATAPETVSPEERERQRQRIEQLKAEREKAIKAQQAEARERAKRLWDLARPAPSDYPYLQKKRIQPHGLRASRRHLVVPLQDARGAIHSLQFISADGSKKFLKGGAIQGHFTTIGKIGDPVYLCEGYATGASIRQATGKGVVVAFNAGNLEPVARILRRRMPKASIVLCADNDAWTENNPGMTKGRQAADAIQASMVAPSFKDTRSKPTDFNDLHGLEGLDAVRDRINQDQAKTEPDPLRRDPPPADPFPMEALGPILGPAARRLVEVIRAPDSICGQSLLAAAALAVQGHANVIIDGRVKPLSVFFLTIGESGERKSAVDDEALKIHNAIQRERSDAYAQELAEHENAMVAWKQCREQARKPEKPGKAKGEKVVSQPKDDLKAIASALTEIGPPPAPPWLPVLKCSDPTYEGIYKLLANGHPSIGIFSDEGGRFVGGYAMNTDNALKTVAGLSGLWDGKPLDRVRGGDGSTILYGRRISIHLMMQGVVAELLLGSRTLRDQGFLWRCLPSWPATTAGTRLYEAVDLTTDPAMEVYHGRMKALLKADLPLEKGEDGKVRNELNPRNLPLADDAKALWVQFHDAIEIQLADGATLAPIRGFAAKAAEHATRVAGVLALVEDLETPAISQEQMERGIILVDYYINEVLRIHDTHAIDPDIPLAERLLEWSQGHEYVYLSQIYQFGPNAIRDAETSRRIVKILECHGWLSTVENGMSLDDKHRKEVWKVWRMEA